MFLTKSKKSPYYQLLYEVKGKRTTVSTKTKNKSEAIKFLQKFKVEEKQKDKIQKIFLSDFRVEYTEYCKENKSKNYVRGCIKTTFTMLEKEFGNPELKDIATKSLDKFISRKYKISPYSALLVYRVTKAALNKAIQWKYLTENPLSSLKSPKVPKKFPIFINQEEFKVILSKIGNAKIKRICEIAFYTGMRISEITHLTWGCIDMNSEMIIVKNNDLFTTKNKTDRIIPMCNRVKEILVVEANSLNKVLTGHVFNKLPGIKYREDYISKAFKNAVKCTSVNQKVHLHTLRHSFASMLVSKGVSLYVVKELLGHSDFSTTQIYAHLQKESLVGAIKVLD